MKTGDMVRFAKWGEFDHTAPWSDAKKPHVGILVEYDSLMKVATVLHDGTIHRVRAQLVEKAGKKDFEKTPKN